MFKILFFAVIAVVVVKVFSRKPSKTKDNAILTVAIAKVAVDEVLKMLSICFGLIVLMIRKVTKGGYVNE